MIEITHLTSVHCRYDTRIFIKECSSLAKVKNYNVNLIVADNLGDETKYEVNIYDVGKLHGRINRIFKTAKKVFEKAKELDSDIYHFHDPELIPVGLRLKNIGKKVIFDIHEDVPKQILAKPYLNFFTRRLLSFAYKVYENITCRRFDYLITPTSYINARFKKINSSSVEVRNYPILDELFTDTPWTKRNNSVCYIGSLAKTRGVVEMVKSLKFCQVKLELGGDFNPDELADEIKGLEGWEYVNYYGYLSRDDVKRTLSNTKAGLAVLHPTDSYLEAIPVKIFEYMLAGLPIVLSDFVFYREMLKECDCALFVDPLKPIEIASAITELLNNDGMARRMGENGKKMVLEKFNWEREEKKLLNVYKDILE